MPDATAATEPTEPDLIRARRDQLVAQRAAAIAECETAISAARTKRDELVKALDKRIRACNTALRVDDAEVCDAN